MNWTFANASQIVALLGAHLAVALPALAASAALAIPLGHLAHWHRRLGGPLLSALGILYAIPSLPLLIVVPAMFGTGLRNPVNMVIVLTLYGVAILARHAADGFASVPRDVLEAARACGYTKLRRFAEVELPLALPVIMAGMRVVAVSTVSLVTVGSVIGLRSLGSLFTDGFQRGIAGEVGAGLVLTVLLALALDGTLLLAERRATRWRRP